MSSRRMSYTVNLNSKLLIVKKKKKETSFIYMLVFVAGTLSAACELMTKQQAEILDCMVVIELKELNGIDRLKPHTVFSLVQY